MGSLGGGEKRGRRLKKWLRRIRGAVGLGLTWAVGWGLVGFGIEIIHNIWPNPLGSAVDVWPAALAYPAFLGGLVFVVQLILNPHKVTIQLFSSTIDTRVECDSCSHVVSGRFNIFTDGRYFFLIFNQFPATGYKVLDTSGVIVNPSV